MISCLSIQLDLQINLLWKYYDFREGCRKEAKMKFHLEQTINADMASFVQEQLLDISIVYQLLVNTRSEDRWHRHVKDICEK